jgi:SNF2 family DNA or RNA helicase
MDQDMEIRETNEIMSTSIRVEFKQDVIPTNIEIVGVTPEDGICIVKYMIDSNIFYINHKLNRKYYHSLFFEITNKSSLWIPKYDIIRKQNWDTNIYVYDIKITVNIVPSLILEYIKHSMALNYMIYELFINCPMFTSNDFTFKSIIPIQQPIVMGNNFKLKLYNYQRKTVAKMLHIELDRLSPEINNLESIEYTYPVNFKDVNILFDPISNIKADKKLYFNVKTKGGILADDMGLGKTISSIALCILNKPPQNIVPFVRSNITHINKINSRATLIICPSHLTKQWITEINRCCPSLNVISILTKNEHLRLTFSDFINTDIIITSHQFIMNFKYYPTLYYQYCTASTFNFENRNAIIKQHLIDNIIPNYENLDTLSCPIFEFFNFHRLILDEGHEIFGEILSSVALCKYMSKWVSNIDANYYWYLSGTPFINIIGVKNCAKFIKLQLEDNERNISFDYSHNNFVNIEKYDNRCINNFMNKNYLWNNILNKISIRHRKDDVINQINIPEYIEKIIWVQLTDIERQLYDRKKSKVSDQYLQLLCCHPLIVESSKKIFGNIEVDLVVMQDKLISHHKENYEIYKKKLERLDPTRHEYHMLKKNYETQMSESKYLYTILEKMTSNENVDNEICSICIDVITDPTLSACGHLFCNYCLKECLKSKEICPICKANLSGKEIITIKSKKMKTNSDQYSQKYGSKLGKLLSMIFDLLKEEEVRIIIFSQWDDMLELIGKTLIENKINNSFVKGNVWTRNMAINKFKNGKNIDGTDNKVIMLSLKNAASGTNLIEATHIFFVEPINASKEEILSIESQAIARACRVGQTKQINIIRILINDTIEEEIYLRNYN